MCAHVLYCPVLWLLAAQYRVGARGAPYHTEAIDLTCIVSLLSLACDLIGITGFQNTTDLVLALFSGILLQG